MSKKIKINSLSHSSVRLNSATVMHKSGFGNYFVWKIHINIL